MIVRILKQFLYGFLWLLVLGAIGGGLKLMTDGEGFLAIFVGLLLIICAGAIGYMLKNGYRKETPLLTEVAKFNKKIVDKVAIAREAKKRKKSL